MSRCLSLDQLSVKSAGRSFSPIQRLRQTLRRILSQIKSEAVAEHSASRSFTEECPSQKELVDSEAERNGYVENTLRENSMTRKEFEDRCFSFHPDEPPRTEPSPALYRSGFTEVKLGYLTERVEQLQLDLQLELGHFSERVKQLEVRVQAMESRVSRVRAVEERDINSTTKSRQSVRKSPQKKPSLMSQFCRKLFR